MVFKRLQIQEERGHFSDNKDEHLGTLRAPRSHGYEVLLGSVSFGGQC